jgi:hypothetical protein
MNSLRSIFKPEPDMRFKLHLKDGYVQNDVDNFRLGCVRLNSIYSIEMTKNGNLINFLELTREGKRYICGLPIYCDEDITIKLIDTSMDEELFNQTISKGQFINYNDFFKGYKVFI